MDTNSSKVTAFVGMFFCVCVHDIHSHHEQDSWYDEAWVGCVAEERPQEGW